MPELPGGISDADPLLKGLCATFSAGEVAQHDGGRITHLVCKSDPGIAVVEFVSRQNGHVCPAFAATPCEETDRLPSYLVTYETGNWHHAFPGWRDKTT